MGKTCKFYFVFSFNNLEDSQMGVEKERSAQVEEKREAIENIMEKGW